MAVLVSFDASRCYKNGGTTFTNVLRNSLGCCYCGGQLLLHVAKESICELKCYVLRNSAIVKPSSGAFFAKRQARQTLVLPHNLQKLIGPAVFFYPGFCSHEQCSSDSHMIWFRTSLSLIWKAASQVKIRGFLKMGDPQNQGFQLFQY